MPESPRPSTAARITWPTRVNRQKRGAGRRCNLYGPFHRFADVVILHVEEDPFAPVRQRPHIIHPGRRKEFHADFVKAGGIAEGRDQPVGFARANPSRER